MKKKIIIIIVLIVLTITLVAIPKSTYQKLFGNKIFSKNALTLPPVYGIIFEK